MRADRLVRGQGPGRRRPDHRVGGMLDAGAEDLAQPVEVGHGECDVDRIGGLVLVLDLGLGERRAAVEAPVDGLQAAVEMPLLEQLAESANLVSLGPEVHREVGILPFSEHAEPDEILLLARDLLGRIGAAEFAHLVSIEPLAVLFLDLVLDRQAVAVPARHIGRVEASERLRADDDVLEDLVDRMADVDVAVCIGRAVVEHEARPPLRGCANLFVEPLLLPFPDPGRLALREVAAHRKRRVGHVERVFVVSH